ncbi:MAG: F0F1 ATP synthase subunit epsilon [Armatimonadota bacterium]
MHERTLKLDIVTPERMVLSSERVVSIIAPGVMGYFGIMPGRASLVSQLDFGVLEYRTQGGNWEYVVVDGGFLEVVRNRVTVLAEAAELVSEIDAQQVQKARERAISLLASGSSDTDIAEVQLALKRATVRLKAVEKYRAPG